MSLKTIDFFFGIWVLGFLIEVAYVVVTGFALVGGKREYKEGEKHFTKMMGKLCWTFLYRGMPISMLWDLLTFLENEGYLL